MGRQEFDLASHGITVDDIRRNLAPAHLYAEAIREERDCAIADTGALIAYSGAKTGRSPKDKRDRRAPRLRGRRLVGRRSTSRSTSTSFAINRERADRLPQHARAALRASTASPAGTRSTGSRSASSARAPYHALFMHNMLIRPDARGAGELRRARLRHLQRRRVPRQPPHAGHDVARRASTCRFGDRRVRHPRHRVRRRDEEGRVHDHELPDARSGACCRCTARRRPTRRRAARRSSSASRAPARRRCRPIRSAC